MATAEDLRFGRKKARTKALPYDKHIHYQGTWPYGARQQYRDEVAARLKEIKTSLHALSRWRGTTE